MSKLTTPEALVRRFQTRDPAVIAEGLEIPVRHLQHPESALPGLTCLVANRPSIFINDSYFERLMKRQKNYTEENLRDDVLQVLAHELGHAVLHRAQLRAAPIREYQIFDVRTAMEAEANEFAAGVRIDREELLDLLNVLLLAFPLCLLRIKLITHIGDLFGNVRQTFLTELVIFFLERCLLDLQLQDLPLLFVEFCGQGVHLCLDQCAGFVHKVDCLVGKESVADVTVGENGSGNESVVHDLNAVVNLVTLFESS